MTTIAAGLDTLIVRTGVAALFIAVFAAVSRLHTWTDKLLPGWYPFARRRADNIRLQRRFATIGARAAKGTLVLVAVELVLRIVVTIAGG